MRHLVCLALMMGVAGWAAAVGAAQVSTACAPNSGVSVTHWFQESGGVASISFAVAPGCTDVQLSLVSYEAPSATYSDATASQQVLYKATTPPNGFSTGNYTLSVPVPSCYHQLDFVYGTPITQLGPAGTDNFYGQQDRLITSMIAGTTSCSSEQTGGGTEANVTLCHATGTPDNGANGYEEITVSAEGAFNGHLSEHSADIIPPFTYNGVTYSQNWDVNGQAVYGNGCKSVSTSSGGATGSGGNESGQQPVVQRTPPPPVPLPSLTLVKLQRVNGTGDFVSTPVTAKVGDTIDYELVVTDTGRTDVSVNLADAGCTSLSLAGPQGVRAGASLTYTCSHVVTAADGASYTNTAVATANNAGPVTVSVQSSVTATIGAPSTTSSSSSSSSTGGVLGASKTIKHTKKAKHKVVRHAKAKKVTHRAKAAHAVLGTARVTG